MSLKLVPFKSLGSKTGVTFKTGLGIIQGHWKWHHFDRSQMSSYSPSIVTMAISCIVCEI